MTASSVEPRGHPFPVCGHHLQRSTPVPCRARCREADRRWMCRRRWATHEPSAGSPSHFIVSPPCGISLAARSRSPAADYAQRPLPPSFSSILLAQSLPTTSTTEDYHATAPSLSTPSGIWFQSLNRSQSARYSWKPYDSATRTPNLGSAVHCSIVSAPTLDSTATWPRCL